MYEKGNELVTLLKLKHVQPRLIDDSFSSSVHENIIKALNASGSFFTEEELSKLQELSKQINEDILESKGTYFTQVKSNYLANIKRAEEVRKQFFRTKIDANSAISSPGIQDTVLTNINFNAYWEVQFKSTIQNTILETLEEKDYAFSNDSLPIIIKDAITAAENNYADYFKNLLIDSSYIEDQYLNAIAESFDPHSNFFTASQNESFNEELSSERELFGISYYKSNVGVFEITNVYPGSSAWLSGEIHVGDELIRLQFGQEKAFKTEGKTIFEIHQIFSEAQSKELKVTIKSNGEIKTIDLVKTKVYSDSDIIKSAVLDGKKKVGYIALPDFYTNWTDTTSLGCANDLAKALIKLKKEQVEGVILDLRDNGGGSLYEAIDLVGTFIDYGPVLIVKDNNEILNTLKDFNRGAIYRGPLIVLINEYSASASEVVAGAIQDYNRGLIVGQKSFGKATGQGVHPLIMKGEESDFETMGFAKISEIGLYRINLKTNQLQGVTPDISLKPLFNDEPIREEHYSNVLNLNPIEKKMYFTPKAKIATDALNIASESRVNSNPAYIEVSEIILRIEAKYEAMNYYTQSLLELIQLEKEVLAIKDEYYNFLDKWKQTFTPNTNQFDAEIYRMNDYLKSYNDDFHARIKTDYELGEAYNIMLDLINQNK